MTSVDLVKEELWRRGELGFKYHSAQKLIRESCERRPKDAFIIVNECSRRFGKTTFGLLYAIELCIKYPGLVVRLVAPTKEQAFDIADSLLKAHTQDAPNGLIEQKKSRLRWEIGKSSLIMGGAANYETLRGREADVIILEEPRDIPSDKLEDVLKSVLLPQLLTTKGYMIVNTTTPKIVDHYFLTNMVPRAKQAGTYNRFTIYDNPMLDEEQVKFAIQESGGTETPFFKREYLCEPVSDGATLVTPAFDQRHIIKNATSKEGLYWICGDVGGITDKTVWHVWGKDYTNKPIILENYVYDAHTPTTVIGADIKNRMEWYQIPIENVWIDAHGQTLVDFHKTCGLPIKIPPKQDRDSAIRALNTALYTDAIGISDKCDHTIRALRSGMWNDRGNDFLRTTEFGHLDAVMAVVYGYRVIPLLKYHKIPRDGIMTTIHNAVKGRRDESVSLFSTPTWQSPGLRKSRSTKK